VPCSAGSLHLWGDALFIFSRLKRRCARVKSARLIAIVFAASFPAAIAYAASPAGAADDTATTSPSTWNQAAAAHYLDSREIWWQSWPSAERDHKTVCVSCHTVVPYALSRSSLRPALGEDAPTEQERILLNNVLRRVTLWNHRIGH
jgi:hypothetical protein